MAKTLIGLYDDRSTAHRVLDELEQAGFGDDHLTFSSNEDGARHRYEVDAKEGARPSMLTEYGIPDDEARFYAEGVRRGNSLVVVRAHDSDVEQALDIMARHNPIRYEDRAEHYGGYDDAAAAYSQDQIREERERYAGERKQRLREIEEHLKVGKREVVRGGVRAHKRVETDAVEETLRLRKEHVDVDRRTKDRVLSPDEADAAFEEDTIEMVERSEEAVVEKEARVTGEVVVGKDVDTETKTVSDTVRKTRIEIEHLDGERYAQDRPAFRQHYDRAYASTDRGFDYYEPAYQYGYTAGSDENYRGHDYEAVRPHLRSDYDERYGDRSTWDEVKDAVRHGYHRARARA